MVLPYHMTTFTVNEKDGREKFACVVFHNLSGCLSETHLKPCLNETKDFLILKAENNLQYDSHHLTKAYEREAEMNPRIILRNQEFKTSLEDHIRDITSNRTQIVTWVQKIRLPMPAIKIIFAENSVTADEFIDPGTQRRIKDYSCHYTVMIKLD